jgi:hypothetical protein
VDWAKIDAALAGALDRAGADEALPVFVHLDGAATVPATPALAGDGDLRSAALTPVELSDLTDQPWVRHVRLSDGLRLLADG